ncbi:MAG: GNAT family N-acetyltransferase [Aphanocapsa sp. GSE-SYN-MK-11-07L]|jgi:GNAT superfamily N-acetyltransferase|nr:GNAT family N-acetyltransferase [Aphanocapsa sp. GSE-SYN-MK-11-07L]
MTTSPGSIVLDGSKNLQIRKATIADIPFLAQIEYESTLPPTNQCFWDQALQDTNTTGIRFIEALLKTDASSWGGSTDFLILSVADQPVAAAAGFTPNSEDYRPFRFSQLSAVAQELGWSKQMADQFCDRYDQLWGSDPQPAYLKPQAPWIIETVAVLPAARGRGLGKVLIKALLDEGRSRGYSHAGIMVINGNEAARRTYESVGFKMYQAFGAAYFDDQFSGITKFRLRLDEASDRR